MHQLLMGDIHRPQKVKIPGIFGGNLCISSSLLHNIGQPEQLLCRMTKVNNLYSLYVPSSQLLTVRYSLAFGLTTWCPLPLPRTHISSRQLFGNWGLKLVVMSLFSDANQLPADALALQTRCLLGNELLGTRLR